MKFWKKTLIAIAAITMGTSASISSIHAATSPASSELKNQGELTIGLEGTYAPFSYRENGKLTGFEVELGKAIAKKMGLKAKFVPTKWDSLIAGLGSGKFDVVMNDITKTPARAKQYNYSNPYMKSRSVLIVNTKSNISSIKQIKGKKIVAGTGTNNELIAKKHGAKIVPNGDFTSAVNMVKQGRVDGEINSSAAWYSYKKKNNTKGLKIIDLSKEIKADPISGLFNKKDTKIQAEYNKALKQVQKDGTVKKLSQKYFGTDMTK
ncbi:MAG: extracellular solute-binding protein [Limosilactobacillus sp.]|uniref:transporter substrate-binding domain-containing protein n=1 Tax=Limosilactobacillus sp. TaxID=2773925 RepID=UPI0026F65D40|nr:extracellular solute-binding protein [Limosilactobacillus sp.]